MKLVNLTEHTITLRYRNKQLEILPSGKVARVSQTPITICKESVEGVPVCIIQYVEKKVFTYATKDTKKKIESGLPAKEEGTWYIVSSIVQEVAGRDDVICPDTGCTATRSADGKPEYIQRFRAK